MKRTLLTMFAAIFLPFVSQAGEWCCDRPLDVISGQSDPKEQCHLRGQSVAISTADYMNCALTDVFHSLKYPGSAREGYNYSMYDEAWQTVVNHIPRIYKEFPNTREEIRRGLLRSLGYFDREHRPIFDPLFTGTPDAMLWKTLAAAFDDKPQAVAKAFYQWCDNYEVVIEFLYFGHPATIDEIVAGRAHTGLHDFGGRIDCDNAQGYIYGRLESEVLGERQILLPAAELLTPSHLRRLINTAYARHGREFKDAGLKRLFSKRNWYKPNAAYDDSLLSEIDRHNLAVMQQAAARN